MPGRHPAIRIRLDGQTRATLQGWLPRQKTPGQTSTSGAATRVRSLLCADRDMGGLVLLSCSQMG